MSELQVIRADWPAPSRVHACVATRQGGVSRGPFAGLNLAQHVQDDPAAVDANRHLLKQHLGLPAEPVWLQQVHGVQVIDAGDPGEAPRADASFTLSDNVVCSVLTADCLPVLICNRQGGKVAAAHAGWRGLQAGVIEQTVQALNEPADNLLVWLGPAIGPAAFEVGGEVKQAFEADMPEAGEAFVSAGAGHWFADIYQLARQRLRRLGIEAVGGGDLCTYSDPQRFYSYRRDGETGRMASLIWMTGDES